MKPILFFFTFLTCFKGFSQVSDTSHVTSNITSTPSTSSSTNTSTREEDNNKRISFIIGPGTSFVFQRLYENPVINQANNNVMINDAGRIKTNLSLGIVYTPYIYSVTTTLRYFDSDNKYKEKSEIDRIAKKWSYAAFINPLAFSKTTENQSFFNMVDFGVGFGYRFSGGLLVLATSEFYSIKQPRKWFVDEYKNNSKPYILDGAIQKSIDINDNSIFTNKSVITFGFKICYSFDIIKNYVNNSKFSE